MHYFCPNRLPEKYSEIRDAHFPVRILRPTPGHAWTHFRFPRDRRKITSSRKFRACPFKTHELPRTKHKALMQIVFLPAEHVPASAIREQRGIPLRMDRVATVEIRQHQHIITAQNREEISVPALNKALLDNA